MKWFKTTAISLHFGAVSPTPNDHQSPKSPDQLVLVKISTFCSETLDGTWRSIKKTVRQVKGIKMQLQQSQAHF